MSLSNITPSTKAMLVKVTYVACAATSFIGAAMASSQSPFCTNSGQLITTICNQTVTECVKWNGTIANAVTGYVNSNFTNTSLNVKICGGEF